jgi:hypothetical protein
MWFGFCKRDVRESVPFSFVQPLAAGLNFNASPNTFIQICQLPCVEARTLAFVYRVHLNL